MIQLCKDIIESKSLSDYAIADYCILKALVNKNTSMICITGSQIFYYLYGYFPNNKNGNDKRILAVLNKGMEELSAIETLGVTAQKTVPSYYEVNC